MTNVSKEQHPKNTRTHGLAFIREAENAIQEKTELPEVRMTTKKRPKKVAQAPVSLGAKAREKLPYSVVYYPNHYGAFFGFAEDESSPVVLCACSETAI